MRTTDLPSLRLAGEIDITRTRELTETLNELVGSTDGAALIDVSGVTFMDSTGLGALVKTNERLRRQSRDLVLVCPPGPVLDLLDATGLRDRFVLADEPAAA
jgi:anti-sigma B factor antagonist